jgi:hypothetical protein
MPLSLTKVSPPLMSLIQFGNIPLVYILLLTNSQLLIRNSFDHQNQRDDPFELHVTV